MSNTPLATPTPPASSAPASNALSQFAVGSIPAFKKAPANYAQAAAKSKPSPPAVNGKEAVAAGGAHSRKPSAAVDNSSSPSAKAPAARVSGADGESEIASFLFFEDSDFSFQLSHSVASTTRTLLSPPHLPPHRL